MKNIMSGKIRKGLWRCGSITSRAQPDIESVPEKWTEKKKLTFH